MRNMKVKDIMDADKLQKSPARGRNLHLSVTAVAALHGVHKQTVLNAIDDGTLAAASYIIGPNQTVVAIGVTQGAADVWVPRKKGRPTRDSQVPILPVEEEK